MRLVLKRAVQATALVLVSPWAMVCGFGRLWPAYTFCAQMLALVPGMIGGFLRGAFYKLTLRECSIDTNISFGTYFAHPGSVVGAHVSIGSYCVIGRVSIGRRTQIASHVEITGGRHQHRREGEGFGGTVHGQTTIGEYCWIGASAIVMGNVGSRSTVGAGAVVVKDIPEGVIAVGNPARVVRAVDQ